MVFVLSWYGVCLADKSSFQFSEQEPGMDPIFMSAPLLLPRSFVALVRSLIHSYVPGGDLVLDSFSGFLVSSRSNLKDPTSTFWCLLGVANRAHVVTRRNGTINLLLRRSVYFPPKFVWKSLMVVVAYLAQAFGGEWKGKKGTCEKVNSKTDLFPLIALSPSGSLFCVTEPTWVAG